MKTLNKLIQVIQSDTTIQRFQTLERIIDQDENLQQEYRDLLDLQKIMVQRDIKKHPGYEQAKQDYETAKEHLLEHVLMSEYLDLLELINEDVNLIQALIEDEINKDFD